MSSVPSPQVPLYRITLFYGPELVDSTSSTLYCVFNLKKRSWKGGIQVVVEVEESQLHRARKILNFDEWLEASLSHLPESEQSEYSARGQDIFVQFLCQTKLNLALGQGLSRENSRVAHNALVAELEEALVNDPEKVKTHITQELDLVAE